MTILFVRSSAVVSGYSTPFSATENPLSESGHWIQGGDTGLDWQNVRSSGGLAFATNTSSGYDDCIAQLTNHSIGVDHEVSGTIFLQGGYTAPDSHECSLYLRHSITAHQAKGYEILFPVPGVGNFQIVRWNGPVTDFTPLSVTGDLPRSVQTGDVAKAKIVGNAITVYLNDVAFATATDSTHTTGNPGMGFFVRPGGTLASYCLTAWSAQNAT